MPIEVEGPDGNTYEFPDDTARDVIRSAMQKRFPPPKEAQPERRGDVFDAARDVAWQLPQGFNNGLDAVVNAPYNLIRAGAGALGYDMPAAQPIVGQLNSGVEPEGTAGRLARTTGEAIGASAVPSGAIMGLAARTAAPLAANAGMLARGGNALLEGVRAAPRAAAAADLASAAGSGVGVGIARENEWGPWGELAAGFAGGAIPVVNSLARNATRLAPKQQTAQNEVLDAAEQLNVPVPRAVAGGDVTQAASGGLKEIPYVGTPIQRGYTDAVEKLGEKASDIALSRGAGKTVDAGEAAKSSITKWITGESKEINANLYDEVDRMILKPDTARPLTATQKIVQQLAEEQTQSATRQNDKAIGLVAEAIARPEGLTYNGVKNLRTVLGQYLDGSIVPEPGTHMPAIKRLYGSLTDDLKATVREAGGENAEAAFTQANRVAKEIAKRRERLATIVGDKADAAPERVFDRLVAMAGTKGNADASKLKLARDAIGDEAWGEVQSATVAKLGRDADDNFSPGRFVTAYGKMSDAGKSALFGDKGGLRQSLDNLATVARRFDQLAKLGNPSGTGRVNSLWQIIGRIGEATTGVLIYHNPAAAAALAPLPAGRMVAKWLGSPTTAKALTKWSSTYYRAKAQDSTAVRAGLSMATKELAKALAADGNADPKEVEARISQAISAPIK
jgi:hypothetical protein